MKSTKGFIVHIKSPISSLPYHSFCDFIGFNDTLSIKNVGKHAKEGFFNYKSNKITKKNSG